MSQYRWSQKSLDELREVYRTEIKPTLQRAGHPRDEAPTYQMLAENGFSGLSYALREHHDMTLSEFLTDVVGLTPRGSGDTGDFEWGIENQRTRDELQSYCKTLRDRRGQAESTVRTKRSRLATYAQTYADVHGEADFIAQVQDQDRHGDEIERNLSVFDELDRELNADSSKLRYLGAVDQFYGHLQRRRKAEFNPVTDFDDEYNWERETPDNPALSAEQVSAIRATGPPAEDELLLYALCAWGLRRTEVAELHVSQLQLDGEEPTIHFEERKNGPGTVSILYGRDVVEARIVELGERDDWSGFLFPSDRGETPHIAPATVYRRFQRLAEAAAVQVRDETPSPQMGRRFWYEAYTSAMEELVEMLDPVAAEQGSSDASVVARNYLSAERRREYRREKMRERLAEAFESDSSTA